MLKAIKSFAMSELVNYIVIFMIFTAVFVGYTYLQTQQEQQMVQAQQTIERIKLKIALVME
ncbi:hypothetical protein H4J56_18220 [Colwellia sp. BRX8-4]|uniref:hypothetical protein n=1 Tax=Colwellia sp. BRX8-4 TaxID=2759836 RepID=UPI0015F70D18|nr:hypothetical protein [Colwellia sp. BRX8-4]MBA6373355.1 hypothetical protein [Colwellia sp. BRX8-4]